MSVLQWNFAVDPQLYYAGAQVATTCSYQASFQGYEQAGIGRHDTEQLLRRSLHLADAARSHYLQANAGMSFFSAAGCTPFAQLCLLDPACGPYFVPSNPHI